jgi:Ca-activated chloride channel homolog
MWANSMASPVVHCKRDTQNAERANISLMWRRFLASAVLFSLFAAASRPAIQDTGPPTFSVSVNLVKVPISVFDEQGNMVASLQRENFRIWEDQTAQTIRSFGIDINPVSVVMLLDTSTSEKPEMKKMKEAVEGFVDSLSEGDRVSLITFDDEVRLASDWTQEWKKVRRALARIRPGLRTALYDAMYVAALDQLKGVDGRKAIILLTDCLDNDSSINFKDALQSIVQSQASFYVVSKTAMVRENAKKQQRVMWLSDILKRQFGTDENYVDEYFNKREAEMTDLAERTGGRCFFPTDYDQIKDVYQQVARELKSKYYLTYVSNQKVLPNSYHRISIEYLAPASKIIYRRGYYYQPLPVRRPLHR